MRDDSYDDLPGLPPELAELDEELRALHLAERASFAPELRAELARRLADGELDEERRPPRAAALLTGVGIAALLALAIGVPQARTTVSEVAGRAVGALGWVERRAADGAPAATVTAGLPTTYVDVGVVGELDLDRPPEMPLNTGLLATFPELIDGTVEKKAIERHYTAELRRRGVGGTVAFRLWVDTAGVVGNALVKRSSGDGDLDRAAMLAAMELRFRPATRDGRPIGTWHEFEMTFEPPSRLPPAGLVADLGEPPPPPLLLEKDDARRWVPEAVVSPPLTVDAVDLLRAALGGQPGVIRRLGPLENLLAGEAPAGTVLTQWRADAMDALERALSRDPDNPAAYLALGRISKKQGVPERARALFDQGVERAERGERAASSRLLADLHYEVGMLAREEWLAVRNLGRIEVEPGYELECRRGPRVGELGSIDAVLGLNYLCPAATERLFLRAFHPAEPEGEPFTRMMEAFDAAVTTEPGHPGASVQILLELAAEHRWHEVLLGARNFAWASDGHPDALLLTGIALQRLRRSEEALAAFGRAFERMAAEEVQTLRDPGVLEAPVLRTRRMSGGDAEDGLRAFWSRRDPILQTPVNEREVEHLARTAHAYLRFGDLGSEPAELWIRYGAPRKVWTLGERSEVRTEFWDYGGAPFVTFRRMASTDRPGLTSEAKAYLADLVRAYPESYGNGSRPVYEFPLQIAHFRNSLGLHEVEIHGRVPEAIRAGSDGAVAVAIYGLGPSGEVLRKTVHTDANGVVHRLVPVPDGATAVVVEAWNERKGVAASARAVLPRDGASRAGRISQALVVEATDRARPEIVRGDDDLRPLREARTGSDRVGVLFELYEVTTEAGPYKLRVDAIPRDGADPIPVPHRPAGEPAFFDEWSRLPSADRAVLPEYLTLDLSDVPPGAYTLRITVDFYGTTLVATTGQPVRRTSSETAAESVR